MNGHLEVCRLLIECQADVNAATERTEFEHVYINNDVGYGILHTCAFEHEGGIVVLFLTL